MLKILFDYKLLSGQEINREKTSLFFSKSMDDDIRQEIKRVSGVQEIKFYEKYLGLPSLVGRGKKCKLYLYKGVGMEKIKRVGSKTIVSSRKRSSNQSSRPRHIDICHGMFQTPFGSMSRY